MAQRVFIGDHGILPDAIGKRLVEFSQDGLPDLRKILLVLPGKAARRNVQDALLKYSSGVLLPQMLTPHLLLHYGQAPAVLPDTLASELLWGRVLTRASVHPEYYPQIFPGGKVPQEKFPAAEVIRSLQYELNAGGFSIGDVADILGSRGRQLAALEELYRRELESCGYEDPLLYDRSAVKETAAFSGVDRIILAGIPDVPRVLREKLAAIDLDHPGKLEIWIGDSADRKDAYDEWGVPQAEWWEKKAFLIPEKNLHCAVDPEDAARRAIKLASPQGVFSPEECAIVLADPSLYADFAREFSRITGEDGNNLTVTDPSGVPFASLHLGQLAMTLLSFLKNSDDFLYASELLRQRDFGLYLVKTPEKFRQLLIALDKFRQDYTPDSLQCAVLQASDDPMLKEALNRIISWHREYTRLAPAEFLRKFFTAVYLDPGDIGKEMVNGISFDRECAFLTGKLDGLESLPAPVTTGVDKLQVLDSFLRNILAEPVTGDAPEGAIAFEGRLEMPFLTQKRVIFCGMNEKFFPDKIDITPFMTDALRRRIGIRSNRETLVRSLCHLESVRASRAAGDLELIVLRQDSDKSALRPSALLFSGDDLPEEALLERSRKLFTSPEKLGDITGPVSGREFKLRISPYYRKTDDGKLLLSVTDLDEYLRNGAFSFYWRRVLGCDTADYDICEPDARLSGIFCHRALELLGKEVFSSEEKLRERLLGYFDRVLKEHYGQLPAMVTLFADNMRQRLEYAAEKLFEMQQQGFRVVTTEYRFGGREKRQLDFAGAVFRGSADRIEFDKSTRTLRILDIKTGKVSDVVSEHCRRTRDGQIKFSRLQLPLYALLLKNDENFRREFGIDPAECRIECAYLVMPSSVTDTCVQVWQAENLAEVLPCAENRICEIIGEIRKFAEGEMNDDPARIKNGIFRPDGDAVLRGVDWVLPNGAAAEKEEKKKAKSTSAESTECRAFPKLPELSAKGMTRCCNCPEMISGSCQCHNGDCSSCEAFNGFKRFNIIMASAGTGKTFSLASRFIQLLSYGVAPESILAITFTKKAAGEIFDRIVKRLRELILEPHKPVNRCLRIPRSDAIAILRQVLGCAKELQISTIDSFFMRILQSFAPELGIWGGIRMMDENDDRMLRKSLRSWIFSSSREELDTLRELLKDANSSEQQSFHASVISLLEKVYYYYRLNIIKEDDGSMPQIEKVLWGPEPGDVMLRDECLQTAAVLQDHALRYENGADSTRSTNALIRRLRDLASGLEKSSSGYLFGRLSDDVKELFAALHSKNSVVWCDVEQECELKYLSGMLLNSELSAALIRSFRHVRALSFLQVRSKSKAVFALMEKYDRIYSRQVRNTGNLNFSDLPGLLMTMDDDSRQMILGSGDHSLEFRLDAALSHYMFDEFQDTSDAQFMVFDPLIKELFSTAGGADFRTFFCVGDLKQSIYQWRGGNPELFNYLTGQLRALKDKLGYDPLDTLNRSYRSSQVILDTVNAFFMAGEEDHKSFNAALEMMKFQAHISSDMELAGHAAVLEFDPVGSTGQNIPQKARSIAGIIHEIKPFSRSLTVGILVQTNETARRFGEELRQLTTLPISIDGKITPVNSMAFQVFRQLLILAEHPGDREADIYLDALTFAFPGEEMSAPCGKAMLADKLGYPSDIPLDEAVRRELAVSGLTGFAIRFSEVFGAEGTSFDRRHLAIMLNVAKNFSGTVQEFLRQIENAGESGSSLDNTIQIMTCHKSKGLEFDIVFLPDIGNTRGNHTSLTPDAQIFDYSSSKYGDDMKRPQWISYLPAGVISESAAPVREYAERADVNRAFAKCCNFYVAMTRAKRALYMLLSCSSSSSSLAMDHLVRSRLPAYGVSAGDREILQELYLREGFGNPVRVTYSHGSFRWYAACVADPAKAPEEYHLPTAKTAKAEVVCRASEDGHEQFVPLPEMRFQSGGGARLGTEVHSLFEKISFIDDSFDAAAFCAAENASPEAAALFCNAMGQDSPVRHALYAPSSECEVWQECRFLHNGDESVTVGAFDRVVLLKRDGKVDGAVIYDYKSDRFKEASDALAYAGQLQIYRRSLAKLLDLPEDKISGKILALRLREVVDIF